MTKQEIEKFRQQLKDLAWDVKNQEASLKKEALRATGEDSSGNLSNVPLHLADLSSDNYEQEVATQLLENERELLIEIADALERIDQGTFGQCENCQQDVSRERLQAVPYTRYCITCARDLEGSQR